MMRGPVRRRSAPVLLIATLVPTPALLALHFSDGPPARVTGGFGEDTCIACHSGNRENDPAGQLRLTGFPARYTPGATYDLELALTRPPALVAAGFQLAVRLATGDAQAGTIQLPPEEQARVGMLDERGIRFAHHRLAKTTPPAAETVCWKLNWTAPKTGGKVALHAAAVAANADESQLGDYVYTLEIAAEARTD